MKKLIIILITFMVVLVGCRDDDPPPDTMVFPEYIALPGLSDIIPNIDNLVVAGDVLYFTSTAVVEEGSFFHTTSLYSINADGTNLTKFPNYKEAREPPAEAQSGTTEIISLCIDYEGNIWVVEASVFYQLDLPSGFDIKNVTEMDINTYRQLLDRGFTVRKLDSTGAQLQVLDLGELKAGHAWFNITALGVDIEGYLHISGSGLEGVHYVLDSAGYVSFSLNTDGAVEHIVRLPDGSVAIPRALGTGRVLQTIDSHSKTWGESFPISSQVLDVFSGNDEYLAIFIDGVDLYGISTDTGKAELILNFNDNNILPDMIENIVFLPDGSVLLTNKSQKPDGFGYNTKLHFIPIEGLPTDEAPTDEMMDDDLSDRIGLTFATIGYSDELRSAVMMFHNVNSTHRIDVIDYLDYDAEYPGPTGAADKLALDIIAGDAPDIVSVTEIPFGQLAARDLFVDLYPLFDKDPALNRSDVFENLLQVAETNGKLYKIFAGFYLQTLTGHPSVVGNSMGWTWDEFMTVINANPQARYPMGNPWMASVMVFQDWVNPNLSSYVDWTTATANFDRGDFIELLELIKRYPVNFVFDDDWVPTHELIADRRQIIKPDYLGAFNSYHVTRETFGGDFVYKGYPTDNGIGIIAHTKLNLAITTSCADKEAAWEFVRIILTEEWQRQWREQQQSYKVFPMNRAVFNDELTLAMASGFIDTVLFEDGSTVQVSALTQEEADRILALIDSVSITSDTVTMELLEIILESASDFFNGHITAGEAAYTIQNRASLYLAEQAE